MSNFVETMKAKAKAAVKSLSSQKELNQEL
jgi:hypothetical protein